MVGMINAHHWRDTSLGSIETWPQVLHSTVSTMLASRIPIYIAWGPDLISIYNDGFVPILGGKHPYALGARWQDVWSELWDQLRPWIDAAFRDESSYFEDLPVQIERQSFLENCNFTFSYSGIRGDTGTVEGSYCVCAETTDAFNWRQQRLNENERLLAMFMQAPGFMAMFRGPTHVIELCNPAYLELVGDRDLLNKPVAQALPEAEEQGFVKLT